LEIDMPQVRALKTFNASRYGYLVRAGVIFSAEQRYADELAKMGMVEILPDTPLSKAAKPPAGKDLPPGPPQPAPAQGKGSEGPMVVGMENPSPSSRQARRSQRAIVPLRVGYPTEPSQ
jgi:hypothetical protein